MGDWVAEDLHLGTGHATVLLGAVCGLVLATGRRVSWTTKLVYWPAVVAARAAGRTAGDLPAFQEILDLGIASISGSR